MAHFLSSTSLDKTCWLCGFKKKPPKCKNGPCKFCVEVAEVDEAIEQGMAALERLHAKRCDLLSVRNRAHDHMNRLPFELKTHIFELVLTTEKKWRRGLHERMPTYLTSICRGWRDSALSMPSLWSMIPIVLGTGSASYSGWVDFVRNWILRSRTLPLTLHIRISYNHHNDMQELGDVEFDVEDVEFDVEDVEVDVEDMEVDSEDVQVDVEDVEVDVEDVEVDVEDVEVDVEDVEVDVEDVEVDVEDVEVDVENVQSNGFMAVENHSEDMSDDFEEQLYNVLDVLSQYPNEWESLSLEIPFSFFRVFHRNSDFQSHLLAVKRLGIRCPDFVNQPMLPWNPMMIPQKIEICGLSFQSLRISWNHLTTAKVHSWDLGCLAQLFQHASRMTYCSIWDPQYFAMPLIIHQRLETLNLWCETEDAAAMLLGSLTLPCLSAIQTNPVVAANIPALIRRSSCPLTKIALFTDTGPEFSQLDWQPFLGVTDLVFEMVTVTELRILLVQGYFPDLHHLTLPLSSFARVCDEGDISKLLGPQPDARNKVALRKIVVRGAISFNSHPNLMRHLKTLRLNINWRDDGFEFFLPAVSSDEAE